MSRLAPIWTTVGIVAGLGLAGVVLEAGDAREVLPPAMERVLYLRSGRVADRLMLSFDALAADAYWIRTIQHYGRDRKSLRASGRFDLLYPLLDLTTTLDPDFNIAYRFGAIFLAQPAPTGPGRTDQAIALLEKGLARNPNQWKYASDIGFIYYWYGTGSANATADYATAAQWFERAAALPGAPLWLRPLAAVTRVEGGDRQGARHLLGELENSEEDWVRRAAQHGLDQLRALDQIDALQALVDRYSAEHGSRPRSWRDLDPAASRDAVPVDPARVPYKYDTSTNRVMLSSDSPLWPLPSALRRK
jgi:tetratricopeptide (TPR) repeat protein